MNDKESHLTERLRFGGKKDNVMHGTADPRTYKFIKESALKDGWTQTLEKPTKKGFMFTFRKAEVEKT